MQTRSGRMMSAEHEEERQVPLSVPVMDSNKCLSSHGSSRFKSPASIACSSTSSILVERLKEKQRLEDLELERKILQAKHKVEMSGLMKQLSEGQEQHVEFEASVACDKKEHIERYMDDCSSMMNELCHVSESKRAPVCVERLDMPRVEMSFFDGTSADYWRFCKEFEYYIENRVQDNGQRMLYLLHYCKGRAKTAIQECVVLPPGAAYSRARSILRDLFGEVHVVAREKMNILLRGLKPIIEDGEALSQLAVKLQNCLIALTDMNYLADLNSVDTIERVVKVLPAALRRSWARSADDRAQKGCEVTFGDLCDFVSTEARISRSRYGHLITNTVHVEKAQGSTVRRSGRDKLSFAVRAEGPSEPTQCVFCKAEHSIRSCQRFADLTIVERCGFVKNNRVCFSCLALGHQARQCKRNVVCGKNGCHCKHHPLLHLEESTVKIQEKGTCVATSANSVIALGVIPVRVRGPEGVVDTYAFLDNGSDVTLVAKDLANALGLEGAPASMSLTTINGVSQVECRLNELIVTSLNDDESIKIDSALTVPTLLIRASERSVSQEVRKWGHLKDLPFNEIPDKRVKLLIGCDVPEAHWALEQRVGNRKQPFAVRTLLGWVLFGPLTSGDPKVSVNYTRASDDSIRGDIHRLYESEFNDTDNDGLSLSVDDRRAVELIEKGIVLTDGHYIIPLPWKNPAKIEENNFVTAASRLQSLKRRLVRDKVLLLRYSESMKAMINKGYAERVPEHQLTSDYNLKWYLPHHPVFNPKKTEKLRIVLDCAATFKGASLNDRLYQGPNTVAELVGVLLRFREKPIAVAADIEEMFMQVKVPKEDRGALRFLWWGDGRLDSEPQEFQMTAHPFGSTSSPFCANYALKRVARDFGHLYPPSVSETVIQNFYVDDCLACFSTANEAKQFVAAITSLLSRAGFRLHKWISNSVDVLESTAPENVSRHRSIDDKVGRVDRTLGLEWNSYADCFVFHFEIPKKPTTRRGILSAVSSIFDPLGVLSPLMLPVKIMLQNLCKKSITWDEPLAPEDERAWKDWVTTMETIGDLQIPRCVGNVRTDEYPTYQLHLISDASEVGYGAAAYIRVQTNNGSVRCNLLMAKARVAPLKAVTIPRLELTAAHLAIKLFCIVRRNLTVSCDEVFFWTDSMTVLYYINDTTTRFSTFVANRLGMIHEFTKPNQWRYIPTSDNPADLASRGTLCLLRLEKWLQGPQFLTETESLWPKQKLILMPSIVELKKQVNGIRAFEPVDSITYLLGRYSKWMSLVKSMAWILRFQSYMLVRYRGAKPESLNKGLLKVDEIREATREIVKLVQAEAFHPDDTRTDGSAPVSLRKLCPVMIAGVLCVGGRLDYADMPSVSKHPAILPRKHVVTDLLIDHYHKLEGHSGVHHVLAALRRRFWVVQGAAAVKRVIGRCIECKRRSTTTCRQLMAPLPSARVQVGWFPFRHVGIDYFGPFFVKRGRGTEKRYGCLFTCLQTRAIHLEVAHSLSTESFIMALLRFIARRGAPCDIYSDNGTNFVGASRELKEEVNRWNQTTINEALISRNIQWHFQPPDASHRGGVWERMIRSVRRILYALCHEQVLTDEVLLTMMANIERILNDRPIVPLLSDSRDNLALTPNHLLLLRCDENLEMLNDPVQQYNAGWRQARHLATTFWHRWSREYLPMLQARQKWFLKTTNLSPGDVVLVAPESASRGRWPLGVIVSCEPSGDGLVRTVQVRVKNKLVRRDIRKVCLLENSTK